MSENHSVEQRKKATCDVDYELKQLIFCVVKMDLLDKQYPGTHENKFPTNDLKFSYNCLITAFTVHLRNLYDFLYSDPKKSTPNDVIAASYFDVPSDWDRVRPHKSDLLKKAAAYLVNKYSSHLTMTRVEESKPTWWYGALMFEVIRAFIEFVNNANQTKISPDLITTVYVAADDPASALL